MLFQDDEVNRKAFNSARNKTLLVQNVPDAPRQADFPLHE
jgi:hypothetical protein